MAKPSGYYSGPVLYADTRVWKRTEHPALFSLTNLGSYNQTCINNLCNVAFRLADSVSFMPLLPLSIASEQADLATMFAADEPLHTVSSLGTLDMLHLPPSPAETTLVRDCLQFIFTYQAVPLRSYSFIDKLLRRCMDELEVLMEAAGELSNEEDRHGNRMWSYINSSVAQLHCVYHSSTDLWDAVELLYDSMLKYANDTDQVVDK